MKNPNEERAQEIMKQIHDVLWNDWDPLDVNEYAPDDEYDSYIGGVYGLLSGRAPSESVLIEHLHQIETETMGLSPRDKKLLLPVLKKLMEIDVSLEGA